MRTWWAKPWVRFCAIGFALFLALRLARAPTYDASHRIVITADDLANVRARAAQELHRAPTETELDRAVDAFVLESALAREGAALGLGPAGQRQQLAERMQFVIESNIFAEDPAQRRDLVWRAQEAILARYEVDRSALARAGAR